MCVQRGLRKALLLANRLGTRLAESQTPHQERSRRRVCISASLHTTPFASIDGTLKLRRHEKDTGASGPATPSLQRGQHPHCIESILPAQEQAHSSSILCICAGEVCSKKRAFAWFPRRAILLPMGLVPNLNAQRRSYSFSISSNVQSDGETIVCF